MHVRLAPSHASTCVLCERILDRYGVSEWQVYLPEDVIPEHAEACNRVLRGYQILNERYASTVLLLLASGVFR